MKNKRKTILSPPLAQTPPAAAPKETPAPGKGVVAEAPLPGPEGKIVGLDCHPDSITAAVCQGTTPHNARQLQQKTVSIAQLLTWAKEDFSPGDLFLLEAGGNSFEIARRLTGLGLRAIVLESAHVGYHAKKYADNDRLAATRLVRVYLAGDAPQVWVPDARSSARREVLHEHQRAVADETAASNAIKGYLNQFTIRLGKRGLHQPATRAWILAQRSWQPLQEEVLELHFSQLAHAHTRRQKLVQIMAQEMAGEPLMLRAMKLLGVGQITAFALLAIIGDISRFATPQKLVAYLGLNPGQRESGTHKRVKLGVGRRGRGDLRQLLIQGAQAILRMGRQTPLGKWGWKLFARKGHRNIAVTAVARKLVMQVWHLLAGHTTWALEPERSLALKLQKLAVVLGKNLRTKIGLPGPLKDCVQALHQRLLPPTPMNELG